MHVQVRLFGPLAEAAQRRELSLELPAGAPVAALLQELAARGSPLGRWGEALAVAVNQEYASPERRLCEGDEVALIPPVSGGAGEPFRITREPIAPAAVEALVASPGCGAVLTFLGTVRDISEGKRVVALEYEAYEPMVLKELQRIGREARARWPDLRLAIWHRCGRLALGEVSLAVAVATPHRAQAFAACRWAVEAVKARLPIWKKEFAEDGSWWVGGVVPRPPEEAAPRG